MVELANTVWRNFVTDGVPSSGANDPAKAKIRQWGTWLESLISAGSLGDNWKATKALLDADLVPAADSIGVVYNDSTPANNGTYVKVGASGAGSWSQLTNFLPGYQVVSTADNSSSANAITMTASPYAPTDDGAALIFGQIPVTNTSTTVTISLDGGTAYAVKTAAGNNPAIGSLVAGMPFIGQVSGSGTTFRLVSDISSAAIQAAAEAAQAAAEAAQAAAEAARDIATASASLVFDTLSDAGGATVPSGYDHVGILRYDSSSPFDPLVYHEVASEPTHDLKFQAEDNRWFAPTAAAVRIEQAGAVPDCPATGSTGSATNNTPAFARVRDYLKAGITAGTLTAGVILAGSGVFAAETTGGALTLSLDTVSNIAFVGSGRTQTHFRLADNQGSVHLLSLATATNCAVRRMTLDGNRDNGQTAGHALRGESITNLIIEECLIKKAYAYGIGLEDGDILGVKINNVDIEDTGNDGIDVKSKGTLNEGLQISNLTVRRHGLDASLTSQAGVDIRGPAVLSNIQIMEIGTGPSGAVGVRFRFGEDGVANGLGGHRSVMNGFRCTGAAATTTNAEATVFVDLGGYNITVSAGVVQGAAVGLSVLQEGGCVSCVQAISCDTGFRTVAPSLTTSILSVGRNTVFSGNTAFDCTVRGFDIVTNNCTLIGNIIDNCVTGVRIQATAADTQLIGNQFISNATTAVADSGTRTRAKGNVGYKTEANLISAALAIDSTGTKVDTITHGLAVTPTLQDCSVFLIHDTAVTDQVIGWVKVESVSSTSVVVRMRVTTASGTGGATMKIGVHIVTKNGA